MQTVMIAWESDAWLWNDFGHAAGEFLTSPAAAGIGAILAAWIAGSQVAKTRRADRDQFLEKLNSDNQVHEDKLEAEQFAKRVENLWKRFEWVTINRTGLGAFTTATMIEAIFYDASRASDDNLTTLIRAHRAHLVSSTAGKVRYEQHKTGDEPQVS